jgi:FkbM family methyltransferase
VGYYTLLAGSQVKGKGHVYAFEANPAVFENLFRSVGINGLSEEITLVNKAVYKTSTKLKFHVFSQYQGSSTIIDLPSGYAADYGDTTELVEVEAVSLDDYFAEQIPKVDFIKIDAEGSEVFIFEGMEKLINQNPHLKIMFEYNPGFVAASGIKPQEFLEKLVHQGFQLKRVAHDSTLVNASIEELLSTSRQHELMAVR